MQTALQTATLAQIRPPMCRMSASASAHAARRWACHRLLPLRPRNPPGWRRASPVAWPQRRWTGAAAQRWSHPRRPSSRRLREASNPRGCARPTQAHHHHPRRPLMLTWLRILLRRPTGQPRALLRRPPCCRCRGGRGRRARPSRAWPSRGSREAPPAPPTVPAKLRAPLWARRGARGAEATENGTARRSRRCLRAAGEAAGRQRAWASGPEAAAQAAWLQAPETAPAAGGGARAAQAAGATAAAAAATAAGCPRSEQKPQCVEAAPSWSEADASDAAEAAAAIQPARRCCSTDAEAAAEARHQAQKKPLSAQQQSHLA